VSAVFAWLRLDRRTRWRSLTALALLIAVAAATVLAAIAGARRGESAMRRLQERSAPVTVLVPPGAKAMNWAAIRRLPQVEAMATLTMTGLSFEGVAESDEAFYLPEGIELLRTVERPVMLHGRLPDPGRADEAVVTSRFVTTYGKGVGASLVPLVDPPTRVPPHREPWLPDRIRIVGVVRSAMLSDDPNSSGQIVLTPALLAAYRVHAGQPPVGAMVRLGGGVAALPAFRAQLTRMTGANDLDIQDYNAQALRRQSLTAFESRFALALAVASLVAFCVLIGPLLMRDVAATSARLQVPRALGMTPRQRIIAAAAGPVLAALVAGPASVVGAVLISAWFPVGSAAAYEPTPGMLPDWPVLVAGWVLVPAVVLAGAVGAAAWAERPSVEIMPTTRSSAVVTSLRRVGAPPPIIVGARMALETGRGRSGVPARQALLGTTAGVVGIVTAFVFASGVDEAAGNARRFGQIFSLGVFTESERRTPGMERSLATIAEDPDVVAVSDSRINVATAGDAKQTPVLLLSVEPVARTPDIVVISGRMPRSPGEVVLGPESAKAMGAAVGSQVVLRGHAPPLPLTVTGLGFVVESWQNSHASGGWVTREGFDRLFDDYMTAVGFVEIRPGVLPGVVLNRLNPVLTGLGPDVPPLDQAPPPRRLGEIQQVRGLPDALGAFLALLAIGALAHVLFTAVQRRRHDFAVMRALGMTRGQARTAVLTQAIVLAVVGLLFGLPVGLALARWLWRIFSDYVPLEYAPPPAAGLLGLLALLAPVTAALLAVWPGHQVARLPVHQVLRAE
jgi:hypothetical protein